MSIPQETGVEMELEENMPLLEWLANNYKKFGAGLEIITDRSQEGSQYVRGFGGIGGMLRYTVDFQVWQILFTSTLFQGISWPWSWHWFFQSMQCDNLDDADYDLDDY